MDSRVELLEITSGTTLEGGYIVGDAGGNPYILGSGGSGIVILARQELAPGIAINRAVKYFLYREGIQELAKSDTIVSVSNFGQEIENIAKLSHQNVTKVIDAGYRAVGSDGKKQRNIPYLVTEYVDGLTLERLVEDESGAIGTYMPSEEAAFSVLSQFLDGMRYLHSQGFFHCDIAPKNVFVRCAGNATQVVIGDLGAGVTVPSTGDPARATKRIRIVGSWDYMPDDIRNRRDTEVGVDEFLELQPRWDLHGCTLTMREVVEAEIRYLEKEDLERSALEALHEFLKHQAGSVRNIEELSSKVKHFHPAHRAVAEVRELTDAAAEMRTKRIPVYPVTVSSRISNLTRAPAFLRLHDVPQLMSGTDVFAGANHTRYEHSLGSYEMMRRMLVRLLKSREFAAMLDVGTLELALLASLLANLTRFPYSHALHEVRLQRSKDDFLGTMGMGSMFDLAMAYKSSPSEQSLWERVASSFSVKYKDLRAAVCGKEGTDVGDDVRLVRSFLNSTVNVRALDMLARDAHHAGFDNMINYESLFDNLIPDGGRVGVRQRGITYVEQVVTMRSWMYRSLYWNEPNRLRVAIVSHLAYELRETDLEQRLLNGFMQFDSVRFVEMLNELSTPKRYAGANALIRESFGHTRPPFHRIFVANEAQEDARLVQFCRLFDGMNIDQREQVRLEMERLVCAHAGYNHKEGTTDVLIDIPCGKSTKLGEDMNVVRYDGTVVSLKSCSGIVAGILDGFESQLKWFRVFVRKSIYEDVYRDPARLLEIENIIRSRLRDYV